MKKEFAPSIKTPFDIEDKLLYLTVEHDKLYAALLALRDFCQIDEIDAENVTPLNNMTTNAKQFYSLNNIVFDYAVEEYRISQPKNT